MENEPGRSGDKAASAGEEIRQHATAGAERLRDEAERRASAWSAGIGDHAENVAHALHSAGDVLRGKEDWLAEATCALGDRVEELSRSAREKSFHEFKADLETMARNRPALFIGAAVTAGVALGRLLRSSPPREPTRSTEPVATPGIEDAVPNDSQGRW